MKAELRKALEKSSQERMNGGIGTGRATKPSGPGSVEWQPPVYGRSSRVAVDPTQMARHRCINTLPDNPALDDYKVLRTQILRRTRENGWRTLMITSPRTGEGKTTTAVNLAITFAKEYHQTVLLVDADFIQQDIHKYMGYDSQWGLADYLIGDQLLQDLILWPGIEKLTVISGGRTVLESAELLASPAMAHLVEEMKSRYADRYIIFDVPAVLEGADAMAFARYVDGILMVVREGQTPLPDITKSLDMIPEEKFLGFTLNRYPLPASKIRRSA